MNPERERKRRTYRQGLKKDNIIKEIPRDTDKARCKERMKILCVGTNDVISQWGKGWEGIHKGERERENGERYGDYAVGMGGIENVSFADIPPSTSFPSLPFPSSPLLTSPPRHHRTRLVCCAGYPPPSPGHTLVPLPTSPRHISYHFPVTLALPAPRSVSPNPVTVLINRCRSSFIPSYRFQHHAVVTPCSLSFSEPNAI